MRKVLLLFALLGISYSGMAIEDEAKSKPDVEQAQDENDAPPPSPEQVGIELEDAETLFQKAKEMFNPWYAGPLLTPSAHLIPPGLFNIQPYLFVTTEYGLYDNNRHTVNTPNVIQVNTPFIFQFGIIDWMDGILTVQGFYNQTQGKHSTNIGDTTFSLGFGLTEEGPFLPAFLIQIGESFPTGKYNNLNPDRLGTDATGSGSYETTISFNFAKVVWWWFLEHPMSFRSSFTYEIPTTVNVKGFHAYGGGYGAKGKVRPGNSISADVGYELSFTQKWVFAMDIVYIYRNETTFHGTAGTTALGEPATNSAPSSDQLSLAPAIEYNPNPDLGLLAGVWFSVYGRNAAEFISAVASFTYTF